MFFIKQKSNSAQEVIQLYFQPKAFKHLNKIHSKNYKASSHIMQLHLQRPLPPQSQNNLIFPLRGIKAHRPWEGGGGGGP